MEFLEIKKYELHGLNGRLKSADEWVSELKGLIEAFSWMYYKKIQEMESMKEMLRDTENWFWSTSVLLGILERE